jgi:hypothetical protein
LLQQQEQQQQQEAGMQAADKFFRCMLGVDGLLSTCMQKFIRSESGASLQLKQAVSKLFNAFACSLAPLSYGSPKQTCTAS